MTLPSHPVPPPPTPHNHPTKQLAVKPKMAELQYRVNDLTSQLEELGRRLAAVEAERDDTARKVGLCFFWGGEGCGPGRNVA